MDAPQCGGRTVGRTSASKSVSYGSINTAIASSGVEMGNGDVCCITIEGCERTPLLSGVPVPAAEELKRHTLYHQQPRCLNCRIFGFLLLVSMGIGLAIYLLWKESRLPSIGYTLYLVHHDIWSRALLPTQTLLEASNVFNVYITHTGSAECWHVEECLDILHGMQRGLTEELHYNFLIAGDCQAYEARGWQYASGQDLLPQATSLVLAFVGDFTHLAPSLCQLQTAQALLLESVKHHKLQANYTLYALDVDALQHQVAQWPHFSGTRISM
ncbi:peptidoglycan-recognition protein LD isoform X2 [Scaptodrosophila lebanonensis]|uniref:Peptidoglycan-recognition protein LD isoform X2 n=1 Tax=Drosophila lebanonensis TaxID=7225 RepID=A0A6J2UAY9_DROLE|nr:peptidoglycan-recognition protein LD isoform X2 [Scaptodrosophila lebanonensis]